MKSKSRFNIRVVYPETPDRHFSQDFLDAEEKRILGLVEAFDKKHENKTKPPDEENPTTPPT